MDFQVNIWQALLLNTYWFCGGSVYHRGGGGQSTTIVFWPGGHFTMGVKILSHTGRCAAACGRAGRPTSAVPGVAAQTTTAQTVWVVNFYSTTKTKQNTTINPATIMTMSAMLNRPGWQRHCDDESVHRYSVRIIDQCDVTIASGSHIDDVTIAKLLTFEIISGAARNERYGFRLSKTTWRFNYKWAVVFCNGEYHQRLNSRPWWQIFQVPR